MKTKYIVLSVLLIIIGLVGITTWQYSVEIKKQRKKIELFKKTVDVGMDIDIAASLLKSKGFEVGKKHNPTDEKDYIVVHVKLFSNLTAIDNFAETYGLSWSLGKGYVTLEAKKHNNIISNIVWWNSKTTKSGISMLK